MMNHSAHESGAGSVLAEMHTLCAIGEMRRSGELHMTGCGEGEGFALNANQCTVDILLHCAIGRGVRLNGRCAFRRKDLYSDAH